MRRRAVLVSVVGLAAIASATAISAPKIARRYLYPTHEVPVLDVPEDLAAPACVARDGAPVHVLEVPAERGARTVVYFHNNRETVESQAAIARELRAHGLGAVLVEYRGYGRAAGAAPSEDGLYRDAEAALDMLASRGVAASDVVLWGTSLGTGVAAEMAARGRGAALVLVSPYTSIPELVTGVAPFVPARALLDDRFDTRAKSSSIRVPTLVVHGDADEIVPFAMGETLARSIAKAQLYRVEGATHGDVLARDGVLGAIIAFAQARR